MTATKTDPFNLPPGITLDTSIADASARAEEYTIVRREKLAVGHFFRDPRRVKSRHPLPWFWHRYTPDSGGDSGWGEKASECIYRILKAASPPKPAPHVTFAEHIIADTLRMCVTEPTAERRLIAEFILKQAFATIGASDTSRFDWRSVFGGLALGGLATAAVMAGKKEK